MTETIEVLNGSTGGNVFNIGCNNIFLDMSPEARETKVKINFWEYIKIKGFCTGKGTTNSTKRELTD